MLTRQFRGGKRLCLGNNFSLFEQGLLLAMLVRRFTLELVPGHQPQWEAQRTLTPATACPCSSGTAEGDGHRPERAP